MTDLYKGLISYMEQRGIARADAVDEFLKTLSERELLLVKDAAVMGYVRGTLHGRHGKAEDFPKDSAILFEVVDACFSHPDLYPSIGGYNRSPDTDEMDD